ncbi:MAG: FkbM family methyltransferase [Ruminiclostridium sp.]|nr:FkbM family methyltransferase [Ruminiclostridium sp.]
MYDINSAVSLWDRLAVTRKPIIMYGMGDGAQKILDVASEKGIKISGFMASDDFVRGHSFAGFEVKKLSDIEKEFGDCIILVAFGTHIEEVIQRIIAISDRHELYAPDVPVIGGGLFTKEYAEEHREELEKVYSLLCDEQSKKVFDGWLEYRITGRIQPLLANQTEKSEAYDLLALGKEETYADLGAYNGDTIEEFLKQTGGSFNKIFAMEPDGRNYSKMKRRLYALSPYDFRTVNAGAWSCDTVCEFVSKGGRNSSLVPYEKGKPINPSRIKQIDMRSLDSFVKDERITYIKYDVEGSESEALEGSKTVIKRDKPKLTVSLYHRTEDIFALPLKVKELNAQYKLYLRQHPYIPAWDMNLYCI